MKGLFIILVLFIGIFLYFTYLSFYNPKKLEDATYLDEQKLRELKKKKKTHELLTSSDCKFLLDLDWGNYLKLSNDELIALTKWYELKDSLLVNATDATMKLDDYWFENRLKFKYYKDEVSEDWEITLIYYENLELAIKTLTKFNKNNGSPEVVKAYKLLDDYESKRKFL
jgi:hypothetical protein